MADGSLVGKKVRVEFVDWPIASATYTYEGHDADGHWVRRSDGTQRHLLYRFVTGITVIEDPEIEPEGSF